MSPTLSLPRPAAPAVTLSSRTSADSPNQLSEMFRAAFGVPFTILDGSTGDLLHLAADQPARDWGVRGELAREVARQGEPEIVEAAGPLVTLAVPLSTSNSSDFVAMATLLVRPLGNVTSELLEAGELLGLDLEDARAWISRQAFCPIDILRRIAGLVRQQYATQQRLAQVEREQASSAQQLATNYEEVSLLYCLIQNLRVTADDDQLARLALEWLGNVIPSQGLALLWNEDDVVVGPLPPSHSRAAFVTRGKIALDRKHFVDLMDYCARTLGQGPVLINPPASQALEWPYPNIQNLIAVPLIVAGESRGWLAAFNCVEREGFSQVEANLFSSVATILGIHRENTDLFRDQSELVAGVVHALTSAIDAKDSFTSGHSDRVARISVHLGQQLGCGPQDLKTLYLAGLLHDVGKIGIDDDVLRKTGELNDREFEQVKQHPRIGCQILADLRKFQHVLPVVLHHHEAWDGTGYPSGLRGEEIPLFARIVAVADAFDAMASLRPYRPGMPLEQLNAILRDNSGTQWDPAVVEAFFAIEPELVSILRAATQSPAADAPDWT